MSEASVVIYKPGDSTIWIPIGSRSKTGEARAFLPFRGMAGHYKYGFKAAPQLGSYLEALQAVQKAWLEGTTKPFSVKNGTAIESQRADKWRHGEQADAPLLSPSTGWIEIHFAEIETASAEDLCSKLESSSCKVITSILKPLTPEGPMFRQVMSKARTFQIPFRQAALELWGAKCAISGATCLLEAAHIRSVANSQNINEAEMRDPFNSIILNVALHGLLDEGLIAFSDTGQLLISSQLSEINRQVFNVKDGLHVAFNNNAIKYIRHHREQIFHP